MMNFTPIMFARHSQTQHAPNNQFKISADTVVMDFSGTEAMPFLSAILGLDISLLTACGLGVKGSLNDDLHSDYSYAVYFFSDTAFRFVMRGQAHIQLLSLINEQQLRFDIDYVVRKELQVMTLSGELAFDTVVDAFNLTPGLRLSNLNTCYGAQSGEVFITAITNQEQQFFQLVAKAPEIAKWQAHLQQHGFDLSLDNAA